MHYLQIPIRWHDASGVEREQKLYWTREQVIDKLWVASEVYFSGDTLGILFEWPDGVVRCLHIKDAAFQQWRKNEAHTTYVECINHVFDTRQNEWHG